MNHPFNLSVEYEPPMGNKIHPIETPELVQHLNLAWSFSRFLSIGIPWNENDPASTKRNEKILIHDLNLKTMGRSFRLFRMRTTISNSGMLILFADNPVAST